MGEADGPSDDHRLSLGAPRQAPELARLSGELFAFPVSPSPSPKAPTRVQAVTLRDPME